MASWLQIRPGWRVDASDGTEVGRVEEVTGDSNDDIFDGLAIAFHRFGSARYVAAEKVAEITDDAVRLTLDEAAVEQLPAFKEPPEEIEISSEGASWWTRVQSWLSGN
jgi:hypothetical protein